MADGAAQVKAALAAVDRLPEAVTEALKSVAKATADRIAVGAAQRLTSQTHGTGKTAASIRVLDESDRKQFDVNVPGDPSRPKNLPDWLERGTRFMAARPYLRPSVDAERNNYLRDMEAAAVSVIRKVLP